MQRFEWSEDLSLGDSKIDEQHKNLIQNVNALLDASREGEGLDKLPETFGFLEEYVLQHFHDEEELQRSVGFPDYDTHKADHMRFLEIFESLKGELKEKGPSLSLVIKTNGIVIAWLQEHLNGYDRDLGRFLAARSNPLHKEGSHDVSHLEKG